MSQTTYNYNKFQYIVEIFEKKGYNDSVVNTICNATEERQRSAKTIAADADVMIVIGGKHSSNSRKLYEICQRECEHTYFIQTLDDLHSPSFSLSLDTENNTITEYNSNKFTGYLLTDTSSKSSYLLSVYNDTNSFEITGNIEKDELFKMIESIEPYKAQ